MNRTRLSLLSAILLLCAASTAFAHHSHSSLDRNKNVTMSGIVKEFLWTVPHAYLKVNVPQDNGEMLEYTIETMNPPSLSKLGWTRESFQPGDPIMWNGNHDRDPDRPYTGLQWAQKPGGLRMFTSEQSLAAYIEESGQEDLYANASTLQEIVPATSFPSGYWTRGNATGGRYAPDRAPEDDWPYTAKAQALVDQFHESQNPLNECIYPGPPRTMLMPMTYHFRWQNDDTIIIDRDLWPEPRVVHMDRSLEAQEPTAWGHSVGWFEDDVLVVETSDFLADGWGTFIGVDSSEQKHLVERFWLSDDGMILNMEMTVTDPVYLTEPVTRMHHWNKVEDRDLLSAECSMEAAWFYITEGYEEGEYEVEVPDFED